MDAIAYTSILLSFKNQKFLVVLGSSSGIQYLGVNIYIMGQVYIGYPSLLATNFNYVLACFFWYRFLNTSKPQVLIFFSIKTPSKEMKVKYCQIVFSRWQNGVIRCLFIKLNNNLNMFCNLVQFYTQQLLYADSLNNFKIQVRFLSSYWLYDIDYLSIISIYFFF